MLNWFQIDTCTSGTAQHPYIIVCVTVMNECAVKLTIFLAPVTGLAIS